MGPGETPEEDWEPPNRFDDFRLVRQVGQGGMGRVYMARDELLERDVAVKFVAGSAPSDSALERFLLEARAVARLQHPNVVAMYRVGRVEQRPYLVCEYVPGQSLDRAAKPMAGSDVVRIGLGIARGLAAAHRRGVLHRDIKPANVVVSEAGEVKLLDFGLAKLADGASVAQSHAVAPRLRSGRSEGITEAIERDDTLPAGEGSSITRTGALLGTPLYLAPELWAGEQPSQRSDVFSLGLVLYELATGQLPRGETRSESVQLPLPSIAEACPEAPAELDEVIARCTCRLPEERYRSADEVRAALEKIATPSIGNVVRGVEPGPQPESGVALRATQELRPDDEPFVVPATRYAANGSVNIAYQVVGNGSVDLVVVPGWLSHLDLQWEEPGYARFLRSLASFSRLIVLDKRGTGLSDRLGNAATMDERVSDLRAVMDAAGSDRAVLFGASEGATLAAVFAANYPDRTLGLVAYGAAARSISSPDVPGAMPAEMWDFAFEMIRTGWGTPVFLDMEAPSKASDPEFARWWAHFLKNSASPGAAIDMLKLNSLIDVQAVLPNVQCPTLVLHRKGDRMMPIALGKSMADDIPGARFVELEGDDHIWFVGDYEPIITHIREMAEHVARAVSVSHELGTVLALSASTTDAATSLGRLDELQRELERQAARFGGTPLQSSQTPGALALFVNTTHAVRCASALLARLEEIGIPAAAGVQLGACQVTPSGASGPAVVDAEALASKAVRGEVLVSTVVRDVLPGTGIETDPSGEVPLPSAQQPVRTFRVRLAS